MVTISFSSDTHVNRWVSSELVKVERGSVYVHTQHPADTSW